MKTPYDKDKYRHKDELRVRLIAYRAAGGISALELTTAIVLLDIRNIHTGACFPRYDTIAKLVGVSVRTAFRYVAKLAGIGLFAILPQRADRDKCSTFDFNILWQPPPSQDPALAPAAARVADYDARFPGRAARVVAKALGISHTSVVRARKAWNIDKVHANACSSSGGTEAPSEVHEYLIAGIEIPEVEHRLEHQPGTSSGNSGAMFQHQTTGTTGEAAKSPLPNCQSPLPKKGGSSATTVAEHKPLEPRKSSIFVGESVVAHRTRPPASAARSHSSEEKKKRNALATTKFDRLAETWRNPNGTDLPKSRAAFLAAVDGGADPDEILAMAEKHIAAKEASGDQRYIPQLDKWLTTGQWKFKPVDRSKKHGGGSKKQKGDQEAGAGSGDARRDLYLKIASEQEKQLTAFERYCGRFNPSDASEDELNKASIVLEKFGDEVLEPALDFEESLPPHRDPAEKKTDPVHRYVEMLDECYDKFNDKLMKAQGQLEREQTPVVGDRVSDRVHGHGDVVKKAGAGGLMVRYDSGDELVADPDDLQRLIPGDAGFKKLKLSTINNKEETDA